MIEMQRRDLIADLDSAADQGSLLVIGGPGSGKTWLLQQFAATRQGKGDVVVFLCAEDYAATSFESLTQSLGVTDFIGALKAKTGTGNFLLIDALDALRAEASQRAFRQLISAVQRDLPAWKVIASMRTFDATESVEFHQLFPSRGPAIAHSISIPARNLLVPSLSSEDIADAAIQDNRLLPLFRSGSSRLLMLLRNPFNLWLAIQLLDSDVHIDWFSAVQSDTQLLDRYWSFRVGGHETGARRSKLLSELTESMVDRNSLTLSIRELPQKVTDDAAALSDLLRNEVLRRSSTGRVSYSHNILFDFAVSKLLIDESNFLRFLTRTPAHSIFYRPSFSYFLTRLWFQDRTLFWQTITPLIEEKREHAGRISVIPAFVIYETAESDDDLKPLLSPAVLTRGTVYVLRAVQASNGLATHKRALWIRLLHQLSLTPKEAFINEFIGLTDEAAQIADGQQESALVATAARSFLRWMWAVAETDRPKSERDQFTSIAAGRLLPVVLKLFAVAPQEAREVVLAVLERLGNSNASTNEPYWLTHSMESIIENDPELAATVYASIFSYEESSQDKTSMGGPVFSMTSTRAQDYSMAYYILGTQFPLLLSRDIRLAARAMTQAINGEVARKEGETLKKLGSYNAQVNLFGVSSQLASDRSEIWDQTYRASETTGQFVPALMSEIAKRIQDRSITKTEVLAVFNEMATYNKFPVLWKRVLEFIEHDQTILPYALPLLTTPEILAAPETTVAAGNIVRLAYQHEGVSVTDRRNIEASILSTPDLAMAKDVYRKPTEIRNRLLGCIPREQLGPEAAPIVEEILSTSKIPENRPLFKIGPVTSGAYTNEDWLRDQGVQPDSEDNRRLLDAQRLLKEFENKYLNETPSVQDCTAVSWPLRSAFDLIRQTQKTDIPVITQVFATVAAVAEEILKDQDLEKESPIVQLCREIVFAAAKYSDPVPEVDADAAFDYASWGSSPKVEAAQGAMHYALSYGLDADLRSVITNLARDQAPQVRFQIAARIGNLYQHDGSFYWEIIEPWLHHERALGVLDALVRSLVFSPVVRAERRKVVEHLAVLLSDGIPEGRTADSVTKVAIDSLTQLYVYFNDGDADTILLRFEEDAASYHNELSFMISAASYYLLYEGDGAPDIRERGRKIFVRVLDSVDRQFQSFMGQPVPKDRAEAERRGDLISKLLKVIDSAVFRLYIVSDANPQLRRDERKAPTTSARIALFQDLSPFWDRLAEVNKPERQRPLAPATMQHLMEIFNSLVSAEPVKVLKLASTLLKGPRLGYEFDQMAKDQVVQLAERILADHREMLSDPQNAARLGDIIDIFVSAGWPQATRLVMQLDSAIR